MSTRYRLPLLVAAALIWLGNSGVWAQEQGHKQEPPTFSSSYRIPIQPMPGPRAPIFAWVDVGVLALCLALAVYFCVVRRSRAGVRALSICSLLYFGFYRQGCICPVGSVQNVALALSHSGYSLPMTVGLFFLLPLLAALIAGRVFCAAVCPLGALQDLILIRPTRAVPAVDGPLSLLPYAYLGAGVLFAFTDADFVVCRFDPFVGLFRLAAPAGMIALGAVFVLLSTVVGRPYCRYLCPYGVLLRWASVLARFKPEVAPVRCVNCHLCAGACPFGALKPSLPAVEVEPLAARRRRMGWLLASGPAILAVCAILGFLASPMLSRAHPKVARADGIWAAALHRHAEPDEADRPVLHDAALIRKRFEPAGALFGAWLGLIVWLRLAALSRREKADVYRADPAACVACARCYGLCPDEAGARATAVVESARPPSSAP